MSEAMVDLPLPGPPAMAIIKRGVVGVDEIGESRPEWLAGRDAYLSATRWASLVVTSSIFMVAIKQEVRNRKKKEACVC